MHEGFSAQPAQEGEQPMTPERRLRIEAIDHLQIEPYARAMCVLVALGLKSATDIGLYSFNQDASPDDVHKVLEAAGLCTSTERRVATGGKYSGMIVARDVAVLNEVLALSPREDHRRYGELMGFTPTMIDAFERKTERLPRNDNLDEPAGRIFQVILSRDHAEEEMVTLRRWAAALEEFAPQTYHLLDERQRQLIDRNNFWAATIKKLRPYGDLGRRSLEDLGEKPYVIDHTLGEQRVVCVGVAHTNDPKSPFVTALRTRRDEFLKDTPKEKVVFMIEGMPEGTDREKVRAMLVGIQDEDAAVREFGEKGALMWSAQEQGIEILSPEQSEEYIVRKLVLEGYRRKDIALMFAIRNLTTSVGRAPEEPRDEAYRQASLRRFAREFYSLQQLTGVSWIQEMKSIEELTALMQDADAMTAYMTRITEEFAGGLNATFQQLPGMSERELVPSIDALLERAATKISIADVNELYDPNDGMGRKTVINAIAAAYNVSRDRYLSGIIFKALDAGKSPFVVYGASHVITIEPAIDAIAEKRRGE